MNLGQVGQTLQNAVLAINNLAKTLASVFPLSTSTTSPTASAGAQTLPANPAGFINVTLNGTPVKVPYYPP
jgi:hypothetical protein